jgi:hypothetical protein
LWNGHTRFGRFPDGTKSFGLPQHDISPSLFPNRKMGESERASVSPW